MSEHDAHRALTDTARLRMLPDPLEDTQRMDVADRRKRQEQALMQHYCLLDTDQPRERRKPATVGERQRLASTDPEGHRQAFVDYLSDQENSK